MAANTDFEADFATGAYAFQTAPAVSYSTEAAYAGTRSIKCKRDCRWQQWIPVFDRVCFASGIMHKNHVLLKGTVSGKSLSINLNEAQAVL